MLNLNSVQMFLRIYRKGGKDMLTVVEAKKKGMRACIDAIGYEFCRKHADNGTSGYGEQDGVVYCFVGISDKPAPECDISKVDSLILTSGDEWPYSASCNVDLEDGQIQFLEVRSPS